jgi:hypothetical protein
MAKVVFSFEGTKMDILCNINDKMEDIIKSFSSKINVDMNKLIFLYGGNKLDDYENRLENIINSEDIKNNQINILAYKLEESSEDAKNYEMIENWKPKILDIMKKYLDDRIYLEDKVDRWRDAILSECNKLLSSLKEYKSFIHLIIKNEKKSQKDFLRNWYIIIQ